jgi:hypothetical protein
MEVDADRRKASTPKTPLQRRGLRVLALFMTDEQERAVATRERVFQLRRALISSYTRSKT